MKSILIKTELKDFSSVHKHYSEIKKVNNVISCPRLFSLVRIVNSRVYYSSYEKATHIISELVYEDIRS